MKRVPLVALLLPLAAVPSRPCSADRAPDDRLLDEAPRRRWRGAGARLAMVLLGLGVAACGGNSGTIQAPARLTVYAARLTSRLPLPLRERIASVPGVASVASLTWVSGTVPGSDVQLVAFATDARELLTQFPELRTGAREAAAWTHDLAGAMVGREIAAERGWRLGDRIRLTSPVFPMRAGGGFDLTVRAIYETGAAGFDERTVSLHARHLQDARSGGRIVGAPPPGEDVDCFLVLAAPSVAPDALTSAIQAALSDTPPSVRIERGP